MMTKKAIYQAVMTALLVLVIIKAPVAGDQVTINTGVDIYSRYVWRGLDIANTPSIQPSLSAGYGGFEIGVWGAYTLSNEASESDEVDFWLGYTVPLKNSASVQLLITDYYFPNAGIDFFNFNDHDAVDDNSLPDPGAHTLELGLSFTGPESFPVTLSGYVNVYNDAGNNTYFQIDYPLSVGEAELGFICGASGGSKDNPDYYGTEDFSVINVGLSAVRNIRVSDSFSIPLNMSLVINPNQEIAHMIVGLSF